ncbi:MAG: transposase [bacterium]|nr:transposase [bacterium]
MKKFPERGSKQLRQGRFSQKGQLYFITSSCFNKQKLFVREDVVQIVFDSIDWLEKKGYIDTYFVIVMPDHLHMIFQLVSRKSLSEVMKSMKGFTGRKIKEKTQLEVPVWQEQFYDHLIRKDESLIETMRYCLYNPVRAGLVENPFDYPYWKCKYNLKE